MVRSRLRSKKSRRFESYEDAAAVVEFDLRQSGTLVKRLWQWDGTVLPGCPAVPRDCYANPPIARVQQRVVLISDDYMVIVQRIDGDRRHQLHIGTRDHRDVDQADLGAERLG
jgi:hypothetical protein